VPTHAAWLFQLVFAATAATIVSGAMAERTQFKSYLIYSVFITGIIYPVVGHWIWGGGWLADLGMSDFAGSTVVHSTGGWLALTGAIVLGPRLGKYDGDGKPRPIAGHNLPLAALGVFILWLGWFGFNPGSQMGADAGAISSIAVTTNLAAAAGAITAMLTAWIFLGKPDAGMSLNGALAGLVTITAGCASVSPTSAAIMGALGGIVVVLSVLLLERFRIDDPVGAVSVHGTCGALGTLLLGFFDMESGVFAGGGFGLLWAQFVGVIAVLAWCLVTGFILFYAIKAVTGLRVTQEAEQAGLDYEEHGASAYPDFNVSSIR
jgi:Amt family ammonium transporter